VSEPLGIDFLGLGYSPKFTLDETPRMPKGRYDIMRAYMPKVGGFGLNMMHNSCTVQVNLDFGSEADMVKKFRVGLALQPLATALFANSVFKDGALNGFQSFRSEVWRDVDGDRTGMLPFVFEEGMGFERYVDYALKVPMYFVYRDGRYIEGKGQHFAKFMAGEFEGLPGQRPTNDDWELHLTTLFPEVRLKQFLEMRGADCGPVPFLPALSAFWTGLLYDGASLDAAFDLIKPWDQQMRQSIRDEVPMAGLQTAVGKYQLGDVAREVLEMASSGLKARERLDGAGHDERCYLDVLLEIAEDGWTMSRRLIDRYKTEWGEDINAVYRSMAYKPD
jgi:glutamate--cysteine ligase